MRKNYNTQITLCVYILFMVCSWGLTPPLRVMRLTLAYTVLLLYDMHVI